MTMGDWEREGIMLLTSKAISSTYARRIHNPSHKVRENPKLVKNDIGQTKFLCACRSKVHEDVVPGVLLAQGVCLSPRLYRLCRSDRENLVGNAPVPEPLFLFDLLG